MSVVGFDIGNENCVIAAAKHGGIDVLLNDESKRETPAVVSFGDKQRFLGSAGAASASMNPKSTISQVKRLIGIQYKDPTVQEDLRLLPFKTSEAPNGGILIHLQYMNTRRSFSPLQILGMLFAHLKEMTEKNLESPVSDCVIGIPSYFTDLQRREYLDAAHIAGLQPLRLMHDCTAIALSYGIYKTDFSVSGPTNIMFIDIGHCDTQVAIAGFDRGKMEILAHSFDRHLGGRDFDEVLFKYFAALFNEQYNMDVYSTPRASIRLRAACEKLKKVLSANAEAPLNIECLMDEKDVKGFITREEFENLSFELLERIIIPCRKAISESGVDKFDSVELVGSGSRIPAIMRKLTSLFTREPMRTLNASECVARGCALHCAMLSPILRVRDYEVQDSFPYSIGLRSDEGINGTWKNDVLFLKGCPLPSVKMLTFHRSSTFHLQIFYANETDMPAGISRDVGYFTIGPFQVPNEEKAKIKVRVHLNLHGICTIGSASLIEDEHSSSHNAHSHSEKMVSDGHMSNGAGDHKLTDSSSSTTYAADGTRKGRDRRQNLKVLENVHGGTTRDELRRAQEIEQILAEQDISVEQTKEKRNTLESFVYDTRSKLLSSYRSFVSSSEKEGISKSLLETEDWLYEDGDDESEQVYTRKLDDLKKLIDPIENRYKDVDARAQATRALFNCIEEHRVAANLLPPIEKEKVQNECIKVEQWWIEKSQLQDSMPKNIEPVLWSSEINKKTEALDRICKHIIRSKSSSSRYDDTVDSDQGDKPDDMQVD